MLRKFVLVGCIFVYGCAAIPESLPENPGRSYVILDAVVTNRGSKQPTWIALYDGTRIHHLSTEHPISEVPSGSYVLSHFDFQQSQASGVGTIQMYAEGWESVTLLPDTIHFIGVVELRKIQLEPVEYELNLIADDRLLQRACIFQRDLFEKYTLRFPFSDTPEKNLRIRCE